MSDTRVRIIALCVILLLGLTVRVAILANTQQTGLEIRDERHYHQLAQNLYQGNGFGWSADEPTSIRPPLYPALQALVWRLAGGISLQSIRVVQIGLALLTVVLIYSLGKRVFSPAAGLLAAGLFCFYPSHVGFNFLLLTETTFTFLVTAAALAYVSFLQTKRWDLALLAGLTLGLAALARSVAWPFFLLVLPLTLVCVRTPWPRRLLLAGALAVGFAAPVAPWAVRNTSLQGTFTVIDTMGGLNLYMGNYAHTPLDRAWDAIRQTGEEAWTHHLVQARPDVIGASEGRKDKLAMAAGLEFMKDNPGLTLHRSIIKLLNFWGLERTLIAGWQRQAWHPPAWFIQAATALITVSYAAVALLAVAGVFLAPKSDWRPHAYLILFVLVVCGIHMLIFGHARYHLPLIPFLCLYAAAALGALKTRTLVVTRLTAAASIGTGALLIGAWVREILFVDADRIQDLLDLLS